MIPPLGGRNKCPPEVDCQPQFELDRADSGASRRMGKHESKPLVIRLPQSGHGYPIQSCLPVELQTMQPRSASDQEPRVPGGLGGGSDRRAASAGPGLI